MERINYASTFRTIKKKGIQFTDGVDTIVYMNYIDELKVREMLSFALSLTVNTNVMYVTLGSDITAYIQVTSTRVGYYYTMHMQKDEFSFSACQFFLNEQDQSVKTNIYGLFFRFCKMYEVDRQTFLPQLDYFKLGLTNIVRLDYAFDLFKCTPETFLQYFKTNKKNRERINQRNSIEYKKQQKIQTKYIGCKGSKFAFFRLYDKTADNRKKKKDIFYFDYPDTTTRLEGQYGSNFVKGYTYEQIIQKIFSYMGIEKDRTESYFVGKRYDPNTIANIKTFVEARKRSTKKLMAHGYDLRGPAAQVNNEQDQYNIRINLKTKLQKSLKRFDSISNTKQKQFGSGSEQLISKTIDRTMT